MKKAILIVAALVLVLSGVAAVSAYEAHTINVKAHVEDAVIVSLDEIDFGTVFPEEWFIREFKVEHSTSFCWPTQWRVTKIDYSIYAEWKPNPAGGYYPWLGDCLYIGIDVTDKRPQAAGGELVWVGKNPAPGPPGAMKVLDCPIPLCKEKTAEYNALDFVTIGLDVPVFEGFYNKITDNMANNPKPSGLMDPTVIITPDDLTNGYGDRYYPDGVTLGVDIKIQVTNIYGGTP